MKKLILTIFSVFVCCSLFAVGLTNLSVTSGYGYLTGNRQFSGNDFSYTSLNASGLEAGVMLDTEISKEVACEAYFAYLFAFYGGESGSKEVSPKLESVSSGQKYTDYKAGLGLMFRLGDFAISGGIDFAGISNHNYINGTQVRGRKVTSFGLYVRPSYSCSVNKKLSVFADVLTCVNFTGWIRTFNVADQKWDDNFDKQSDIFLFSVFPRIGAKVNIF